MTRTPDSAPEMPLGHEYDGCIDTPRGKLCGWGLPVGACHHAARPKLEAVCGLPESAHLPAVQRTPDVTDHPFAPSDPDACFQCDLPRSEHASEPAVKPAASEGLREKALRIAETYVTCAWEDDACERTECEMRVRSAADEIRALVEQATREAQCKVVVGFYEDEWPHYSDEWTHELQSPVTAAELNTLIANYKTLAGALVRAEKAEARCAELEKERDEARKDTPTADAVIWRKACNDAEKRCDAAQAEAKALQERVRALEALADKLAEAVREFQANAACSCVADTHLCSRCVLTYDEAGEALSEYAKARQEGAMSEAKHTPLKIVDEGSAEYARPAGQAVIEAICAADDRLQVVEARLAEVEKERDTEREIREAGEASLRNLTTYALSPIDSYYNQPMSGLHLNVRNVLTKLYRGQIELTQERDAAQAEAKALRERVGKLEDALLELLDAKEQTIPVEGHCRECDARFAGRKLLAAPAENAKA